MLYINCSCIVNIIIMFTNKHKENLFLDLQKKIKGRHTPPQPQTYQWLKDMGDQGMSTRGPGGQSLCT